MYIYIILFIFYCSGPSLLCGLFSSCGGWGLLSSCGVRASHCRGFSCCRARAPGHVVSVEAVRGLQSTGSIVLVHGPSCSATCGIFPDQKSNPCLPHWQTDSLALSHQESPLRCFIISILR